MCPYFNFLIDYYLKTFGKKISPVLSPKTSNHTKLKLHPFAKIIYWKKWNEDKEKRKKK